ncbi:MAG TPA: hypothetical protein VHV78_17025 [Gemmatimonadaceae bacterium]|jgi:hypothetical protein|nr:hypothetical protein [Gemmatimonadaceae bacterium]
MSKRDGHQPGAQPHAEGEHGRKTHDSIVDELEGRHRSPEPESAARHAGDVDVYGQPLPGKHRLRERREQHDLAEKDSEASEEERLRE